MKGLLTLIARMLLVTAGLTDFVGISKKNRLSMDPGPAQVPDPEKSKTKELNT